jgi:hypothetical protein
MPEFITFKKAISTFFCHLFVDGKGKKYNKTKSALLQQGNTQTIVKVAV